MSAVSKPTIIVNLGYKQKGEIKSFRSLLKYLQYRDGSVRRDAYLEADLDAEFRYPEDVSDHVRPQHRETRWVDRGMGETYRQIANRAYDWQGRRMLARTWVISPDPELMKHVPEAKRFEVVRNVTEKTVERWYSDNGWGLAEYSYVIHDKQRSSDGEQMAHAHVITPGTVRVDETGELGRIDHVAKKPHIRDLHRTARQALEEELGRVLGKERARALIAERDARLERERDAKQVLRKLRKARVLADVMEVMKAEQAAKRAKKASKKRKREALQRQAELRMYVRYVVEERDKRREADRLRAAVVRQQRHRTELEAERTSHRQRVARITRRGRRVPTHADIHEREERKRRELAAYYALLFAQQGLLERSPEERARGEELER